MSLNRIYQGRISKVEIANPDKTVATTTPFLPLENWQEKLWQHHVLFQDAVNYNITAIAALGSSSDSPLTKLQSLLREVWDSADKKGQTREGMGESFKRIWQLDKPPTFDEAVKRFREPLEQNGVASLEMELAGEALLHDLGGDGAIQQGGRTYFPMFCQSGFARGVTFMRSSVTVEKNRIQDELPEKLWNAQNEEMAELLRKELKQSHFCIFEDNEDAQARDIGNFFEDALKNLLSKAAITEEQRSRFAKQLESNLPEIVPWKGTSLNKKALLCRFQAFIVFKHLCTGSALEGVEILRKFYKDPFAKLRQKVATKRSESKGNADKEDLGIMTRDELLAELGLPSETASDSNENEMSETEKIETRLLSGGDDPVKIVRDKAQIVFRAFSALTIWQGEFSTELHKRSAYKHEINTEGTHQIVWSEFDVAAFKEALKVWNQFKQNVEKREAKLDGLVTRLLVMNGEKAIDDYNGTAGNDLKIRARLERIWKDSKGKPKMPKTDGDEEDAKIASFAGDPRIERLRKIINDDLAEEYRLTEGRKTAYGLRRRTMKGWDIVKREWRKLVESGEEFSEEKRTELQAKLDDLRGGDKREQIGSHKLFSALIADEAAWQIWREPTAGEQAKIDKNNWANDPLEAFREYKETCDTLDEISARPLRFTPADAKFSRRLFMFTDVCSFGKQRGEYKHDLKNLAVTVPVAVRDTDGKFTVTTCRLVYSAPRLLRDRIRETDGAYEQDWTQPMMRALFGEKADEKANPQELADAAVALMPDFDNKGKRRFLLNFPLSLDETKIKEKIGKEARWAYQLSYPYLNWPSDIEVKKTARDDPKSLYEKAKANAWWRKVETFRVLSADLGTRHTASVALLECGKERKDAAARFIGKVGDADWFARFVSGTVLRLLGENAQVLRLATCKDKDAGKKFREELYGERGRSASIKETQETAEILTALGQEEMTDGGMEKFSFPEQNDKLLVAVRRMQSWIATCVSLLWKLENPEGKNENDTEGKQKQREAALKEISEQDREASWAERAKAIDVSKTGDISENQPLNELCAILRRSIGEQRERVQGELLTLTHRILPLRGRNWEWVRHPDYKSKEDSSLGQSYLLRQTADGTGPEKVLLAGQRGLSVDRIEQLSELRRRWQSLNQSLRVTPGERPPTAAEMRNESIPDPCPDILRKLENIREQRVNQTAHLILAEALGLKLREPELSAKQRRDTDTHGEYKVVRPPVDFIVLENLNRYLTDQGRAKRENSRLMKWCHRQITAKLKMLAEPFGIAVLETNAAYTSRFCSLTGAAGFRAVEVGLKNKDDFRWRTAVELAAVVKLPLRLKKKKRDNAAWEEWRHLSYKRKREFVRAHNRWKKLSFKGKRELVHVKRLFANLERMEKSGRKNPMLLAPQPGGPIFVTAKAVKHPIPVSVRFEPLKKKLGEKEAKKHEPDENVAPMQADINAAINIGLRAIAHPERADIHHRVRTERKKENILTRETRRFDKEQSKIIEQKSGSMPKEKNSNLFYDKAAVVSWGRARLENDKAENDFSYASGPALWKTVNDWNFQWMRCETINAARLGKLTDAGDVIY